MADDPHDTWRADPTERLLLRLSGQELAMVEIYRREHHYGTRGRNDALRDMIREAFAASLPDIKPPNQPTPKDSP